MREIALFNTADSGEYSDIFHARLELSTKEVTRITSAKRVLREDVLRYPDLDIESLVINSGGVNFGRLRRDDVYIDQLDLVAAGYYFSDSDFEPFAAVALDIRVGLKDLRWRGCERYSGENCGTEASWDTFELTALSHGLVQTVIGEQTTQLARRLVDLHGLEFKSALGVLADHLDELSHPDWVSARLRACDSLQEFSTIRNSQFLKDLLVGGGA